MWNSNSGTRESLVLTSVVSSLRLKPLESAVDFEVPATQPFVIRLDGVAFSTFTKGLPRPFDFRLTDAMVSTTVDLLTKFNATMAYTQSDEISLVFPAQMGPLVPLDLNQKDEDKAKQGKRGVKRKANEEGGASEGREPSSGPAVSSAIEMEQTDCPATEAVKEGGKPAKEVQRNHPYNGRVQKLASCTASVASARLNFYLQ
jgi:tRNA(His) guanylyltransferase